MIPLAVDIVSALETVGIHINTTLAPYPVGRPDQRTHAIDTDAGSLVIKVFQPGKGRETFENMTSLWESSFGIRRHPPGLPRPVAFLEEASVLVMERLEGYPMVAHAVDHMASGLQRLDDIATALADLHSCDAVPSRKRSARRLLRSIERKVSDLSGMASEALLAQVARQLGERLADLNREGAQPVELVPSHGDFSPRNIFLSPGNIALIDWDRFQLADPARDLAYFGAWCWVTDLRSARQPDWSIGDALVERYLTYRPVAGLGERIGVYRAVGLARIAHSQVVLWKSQEWVPAITEEAMRWLV